MPEITRPALRATAGHGSDPSKPSLREIAERASRSNPRPVVRSPAPARDNEDTGYVEVSELRNLMLSSGRPIRARNEEEEATRMYVPVTPLAYARSEPPRAAERRAVGRKAAAAALVAGIALGAITAGVVWIGHRRAPSSAAAAPPVAAVAAETAAAVDAAPAAAPPKPDETSVATLPDVAGTAQSTRGAPPGPATRPQQGPVATPPSKAAPGKPADLASAIAAAAGDSKPAPDPAPAPVEAPAPAKASGLPEQPSQAAVRSALASVKGAAKACVAEADGPSRAAVVFAPSGAVTSVGVSGWAKGPAAACIKAAFKPAHVDPFGGAPFTVGVTINP